MKFLKFTVMIGLISTIIGCSVENDMSGNLVVINNGQKEVSFSLNAPSQGFTTAPSDNPTIINYTLSGQVISKAQCDVFLINSDGSQAPFSQISQATNGTTYQSSILFGLLSISCSTIEDSQASGQITIKYQVAGKVYTASQPFTVLV